MSKIKERAKHPSVWASITYFAEGFPYSVVHYLASLFFTYNNVRLELLGLISLYHIPWNLKFLWSTLVDQFGTKKKWIFVTEFFIFIGLIVLALVASTGIGIKVAAVLFLILAFISATHDVAIDGYYLEKLSKEDQAKYVGWRVMAYRMAMLVVGSGVVYMAQKSWSLAFWCCVIIMGAILLYNLFILPEAEREQRGLFAMFKLLGSKKFLKTVGVVLVVAIAWFLSAETEVYKSVVTFLKGFKLIQIIGTTMLVAVAGVLLLLPYMRKKIYSSNSFFAKSFVSLLDQPKIPAIILFVLLFRLGENLLLSLKSPFFKGIGVTLQELSIASGVFGTIATIVGSILGGWLISRFSFKKMIWPCVLSQNIFNLLYMLLAVFYADIYFEGARPEGAPVASFALISLVIGVEALGAGVGTAAFMVYIMRCVKKSYKASHTAFWTAIMSIGVIFTGPISGALAKEFGFSMYFGLSFLITIPSMILILFVPYLDEETAADYDREL